MNIGKGSYWTCGEVTQHDEVCVLQLFENGLELHNLLFDSDLKEFVESHKWQWNGRQLSTIIPPSKKHTALHRYAMNVKTTSKFVVPRNGDLFDVRRKNLAIVSQKSTIKPRESTWFTTDGEVCGIFRRVTEGRTIYVAGFRSAKTSFGVKKYGERGAALLACKWRVEQMEKHGFFMETEPIEFPVAFEGGELVPYEGRPSVAV